jgi:hypothetical protein
MKFYSVWMDTGKGLDFRAFRSHADAIEFASRCGFPFKIKES